ncbi:MAG: hypothetical protein KC549_12890 [Myxococcales bacterium]|nr:hypothetical protein [Myxococcales bacterium]
MKLQGLQLRIRKPGALADADVDTLWRLRGRLIDLRPEIDPADDRAAFFACIRAAHRVAVLTDAEGEVVGFQDISVHKWPKLLILQGEYGFLEPRWRGHPMLPIMTLLLIVPPWVRHQRGRDAWYVGDAYPSGFLPFARSFPVVYLAGEADVPAAAADFVAWLPQRLYGDTWEPEASRVRLRTRPRPPVVRSARDAAVVERYERVNPGWAGGYAAFLLLPLDARFLQGLPTIGRRLRRGLTPRGRRGESPPPTPAA